MGGHEHIKTVGGRVYIMRFRPIIQVGHIFLLIGMVFCFFTGLAMFFKFGETTIFAGNIGRWLGLPAETTGRQLISWLHDWIGPILMLIGIVIVVGARGIRGESIREAMVTGRDLRELWLVFMAHLGRAKKPKYDFYNPLQKLWILVVVIGLILLGVSGIFLVLEKWFTIQILGGNLRMLISLLHIIGAFIFFVALPIHFLMSILPLNWPILKSQLLFRGYVEFEWWRAHHPAYVERVMKKEGGGGR
jgi:formate dehydrogenase subunit gamma